MARPRADTGNFPKEPHSVSLKGKHGNFGFYHGTWPRYGGWKWCGMPWYLPFYELVLCSTRVLLLWSIPLSLSLQGSKTDLLTLNSSKVRNPPTQSGYHALISWTCHETSN